MTAARLFVFAGAGASCSMPAGLPMFNAIRDRLLRQLGLDSYLTGGDAGEPGIAAGLAPEPFLQALDRSGVQVTAWLEEVLGGSRPNAVHHSLAQLATKGARVWTVNFDDLIETAASHQISCVAWPDLPDATSPLLKPHGSVGGRMVFTAAQVLAGLDEAWRSRLRSDVSGRIVIFIGYSGRDLDFQPLWNSVLATAEQVLWFDFPDREDEQRKRHLLRTVDADGRLSFPAPDAPGQSNPSWEFVRWCQRRDLVDIDSALVTRLLERVPGTTYPALTGALERARATILGLLGDTPAERATYLRMLARPGGWRAAAGGLLDLVLNHGAARLAIALRLARFVPPLGPLRAVAERAERKRVTALSKLGRHSAVLWATRDIDERTRSTLLVLRSASLRITGSLDEAAQIAAEARRRAITERHAILVAHASFQECLALLWAERVEDARRCLHDQLRPTAAVAASRWVAWAEFIAGCVAVRDRRPEEALAAFDLSQARFQAEGLLDGVTSVLTARLAALRLRRDDTYFRATLAQMESLRTARGGGQRYYSRGHRFTDEALLIERAEFSRSHTHDLDEAWRLYSSVATSPYPLHAALAELGLGMIERERAEEPHHATTAGQLAARIGARLVSTRAADVLATSPGDRPSEVYFC